MYCYKPLTDRQAVASFYCYDNSSCPRFFWRFQANDHRSDHFFTQ